MRHEFSDQEWSIICAMLPTKTRGVPRFVLLRHSSPPRWQSHTSSRTTSLGADQLTLRRQIALLVKLTLAPLKLDNQSAHLLRQSSFLLWELLPERVAKYLDSRLLHARL